MSEPIEDHPATAAALRDARESHLNQLLGGNYDVLQEKTSDDIRLDVYVFDVEPERAHLTLVTSGMSDLPMTVPAGLQRFARAELVISLPSPWPGLGLVREGELSDELADDRHYWPIRALKELARRPHDRGDWLGMGHAVHVGDLGEADATETPSGGTVVADAVFAGTPFSGVVLGPLLSSPPGLSRLSTPAGPIHYYAIFPVTPDRVETRRRPRRGPARPGGGASRSTRKAATYSPSSFSIRSVSSSISSL